MANNKAGADFALVLLLRTKVLKIIFYYFGFL